MYDGPWLCAPRKRSISHISTGSVRNAPGMLLNKLFLTFVLSLSWQTLAVPQKLEDKKERPFPLAPAVVFQPSRLPSASSTSHICNLDTSMKLICVSARSFATIALRQTHLSFHSPSSSLARACLGKCSKL